MKYKSSRRQNLSMHKLNVIILLAYLFNFTTCQSIVETKSGPIQGVAAQFDDVEAYLSVPYAEPPIGDLRFKKPVPKQPWTETHEASSLPPPCIQNSLNPPYVFFPNTSDMSEDCLYLNIWKPKAKPDGFLRPIIVYIHYGGFTVGSSNQLGLDGSYLARQGDMVVVTINYRLGCLGFLLAGIEEANGNMGIYDQLMAIQWVKNNAQAFEGDPDNIVLMGTSAGAISISAHIISPLSQNLFRRAIIMSGTIFNPLWMDENENLLKSSGRLASVVGCANESLTLRSHPRFVVECLRGKPTKALVEAQDRLLKSNPSAFYPRVGDEFLPVDAVTAYRKGKFSKDIDVMFGIERDEGTLFLLIGVPEYFGTYGKTPFKMSRAAAAFIIRLGFSIANIKESPKKTKFYLERVKNRTSDGYKKAVSDIIGDFTISCSSVFAADFLSLKGNRVYFYKFGFRTEATPMADWVGVCHGEDIQYIFGYNFYGNFTAEEVDLSKRHIARISAFAYTGNPNIPGQLPWMQYSYSNPLYLNIAQDGEGIRLKPLDRCKVWRKDFRSEIDPDLH